MRCAGLILMFWFGGRGVLRSWLLLVTAAVFLTVVIAADALGDETGGIVALQDAGFPGERISSAVRAITATEAVLAVGAIAAAVHWLRGDRPGAIILVVLLLVLVGAQSGLKELIDRPRPQPGDFELLASYSSPSFPSGHIMSPTVGYGWLAAVALSGAFGVTAGRAAIAFALVLLCLAALANVYTGVHWPTDTLGGFLWGLVLLLPAVALHRFKAMSLNT